jgi:hypothetical protein
MKKEISKSGGYLLIQVLVFGAIAVVIIGGLIAFAASNIKLGRRIVLSEQAFQMAEAGLEYYRWHLAHSPADYTNGTGLPGPYTKNFYNKDGVLIGTFRLDITAPPLGSTLVTIQSTGIPAADPNVRRTVLARLAVPSFANFALVTTAAMRFGEGTEVFGPVHSNSGIRFDGLAHNLVTSSLFNYDDLDHNGSNEFGVHTHRNAPPSTGSNLNFRPLEAPPNLVQIRSDVFIAGRNFPAPQVNFNNITTDLEQMQVDAQASGLHFGSSGAQGYRVVLRTNDTFDLYRVNTLRSVPSGCENTNNQTGWGTWSVNTTTLLGNHPFPANGLIFFGDHIWVEGAINGARITIVAARIPDNNTSLRKSITVNSNLSYTNYDGSDVVALIAQNNFNTGLFSANVLRVDAAIVAQNGRIGRYFYESDCSPNNIRSTITLYGTLVTALRYGFAYSNSFTGVHSSGYVTRNLIYDSFLLYEPPPFFPQTEDYHEIIFWKEIE